MNNSILICNQCLVIRTSPQRVVEQSINTLTANNPLRKTKPLYNNLYTIELHGPGQGDVQWKREEISLWLLYSMAAAAGRNSERNNGLIHVPKSNSFMFVYR